MVSYYICLENSGRIEEYSTIQNLAPTREQEEGEYEEEYHPRYGENILLQTSSVLLL